MNEHLKRMQSEVDEMNKTFNPFQESSNTSVTEPPGTVAPSTDLPGDLDLSTDSPSSSAPSTTAPSTDAPDERDQVIADLRAKLAEKETKPEPEPQPEPELKFEEQDFVGDLDFDTLVSDPKEFNKFLNTFYQKAVTDTRRVLGEGVLRSIPDIVRTNLTIMTSLQEASKRFYEENKDLEPFKRVVATVFEDLSSANPGKTYEQLMPEVAAESRKRLELTSKALKPKGDNQPPRLPRKQGRSGTPEGKPNLTPIESELDAMNKVLLRR